MCPLRFALRRDPDLHLGVHSEEASFSKSLDGFWAFKTGCSEGPRNWSGCSIGGSGVCALEGS